MSQDEVRNLKRAWAKMGEHIVRELSVKFKFPSEEALEYLNLVDKIESSGGKKDNKKKKKSSIPLPFCGVICEKNCSAVRLNHNLYTQCTNEKTTSIGGHNVCERCEKQIEKNSNKMPSYGYISERVEKGATFRDPKGKAPANYGNIMEKLKISRNDAEREAANQGLTIPEDQFEVKKARRGRPKKDTTAVDTSGSDEETPKPEKKRGRPKKEKEIVSSIGDELIKDLVKAVNTPAPEAASSSSDKTEDAKKVASELVGEEDDEAGTEVDHFTFKGKEYLKSSDNTLYNVDTWAPIGTWNEETDTIEEIVSDED